MIRTTPKTLSRTALAACIATAFGAQADVIHLKGGDRLSGTILGKDGETLTVETTYAGKVPVKWAEVNSIETSEPRKFMLADGTVMQASASGAGDSAVVLRTGQIASTQPIALADIAYINPPPEVTGEGVSTAGHANLGWTANRGNTDNDQLLYDAEAIVRSKKNRFTIGAAGEQKEESGTETARNNRGYIKYDHFLTPQWYAYANADVEEDEYKDLNLRTTIGGGAGYQFFDTKTRSLALEGGLTYVNNDYDLAEDDGYAAGRWALRYLQDIFDGKAQFFHDHEGLVSVEEPDDTIIRLKTGLRFPLVMNLNATLQYNVDWQNNPPEGFDSTDSSYIVSVGYLW
jgi:putative salt-induced outer membrane protein YdiY